ETGSEGWTTDVIDNNGPQPNTQWARNSPGYNSSFAYFAEPYSDLNEAHLKSPAISVAGTVGAVEFFERHDLEQPISDATTTNDALRVEYSSDGGATWNIVGRYQGRNASY